VSFKVKIRTLVRGAIGMCGLNRAEILRLHLRIQERLEDLPDAIRAKRSLKRPECFVFQAALAGQDANYWFHFLVNDQAEPGTLIVQHVVCERRPRPESD